MILSEMVSVPINYKNYKNYKSKGYDCTYGVICNIKVKDLPENSHTKINVKCDICEKEKEISYQKYNKNISKYNIYSCSEKCAQFKNKITNNQRYGVDYPTQNEIVKNKTKNTNNIRYGVDNVFESDIIKKQIIETNNRNFGVNYPQQNKEILEKSNITNIKRYGFNRPSKSIIIKNKITESNKLNLINKFNKLNILNINYDNSNIIALCEKGHEYNIHLKTLYGRYFNNHIVCTVCNPIIKFISNVENDLLNYIKEIYKGEILTNDRKIISPLELDIYLPELKLAFEFNGLYWHNEINKDNNYHKMKTDLCEENGIQLIHIYEDEWNQKQNIVKSMILNKLKLTINKIFARKTEIREITDNKLIKDFLNKNHLQGFIASKIKMGLFYENELVSLMTFGTGRKFMNTNFKENNYEMIRFCNKLNTNVIGGASKLFKYFIKTYNPVQVISYADRSHSNGNLYIQLGFKLSHITDPNYYYIIDGNRKQRFGFRKDVLVKQGFDPNKSEHEIMLERNIYRIYNSGNLKFILL